jgi:hypothetical protein
MLPKSTDYILCEKRADETLLVVVSGKKRGVYSAKPRYEAKNPDKVYEIWPNKAKVGEVLVSMKTIVDRSIRKMNLWKDRFEQVFGVYLSQFWDGLCGFNVIKFDERLVKPTEGVSCMQSVKERYGDAGVEIINALLTP